MLEETLGEKLPQAMKAIDSLQSSAGKVVFSAQPIASYRLFKAEKRTPAPGGSEILDVQHTNARERSLWCGKATMSFESAFRSNSRRRIQRSDLDSHYERMRADNGSVTEF